MLPAHERLDADRARRSPSGTSAGSAARARRARARGAARSRSRAGAARGRASLVEERAAAAAALLRAVHGGVGVARAGPRRVGRRRGPARCRCSRRRRVLAAGERRTGCASAPATRRGDRRRLAARSISSQRIANSSPPSRATVSAGRSDAAQALGDRDEQHVAGGVAEGVVDELEAVEVEAQHGERAARARRGGEARGRAGRRAACGSAAR